jgi:hypothetical protein
MGTLPTLPSLGNDDLGIGSGTTLADSLGSSSASANPSPSLGGLAQGISKTGQGLLDKLGNQATNLGASAIASLFGLNAQSITVLLGLIFIAGGIFLFRPVQQVVVGGVKKAGRAAADAAIL